MKKNNVGILTHPFRGNFGGMLQAYSLYAVTNDRQTESRVLISQNDLTYAKAYKKDHLPHILRTAIIIFKYFLSKIFIYNGYIKSPHIKHISNSLSMRDNFTKTLNIFSPEVKQLNSYIVGSDQVWRASYARILEHTAFFFLDFASTEQREKSISYAASFGTDEWEGSPEETSLCRELLCQFKAVSVREFSGVRICKEVFGVEAVQMPDPTLLSTLKDYERVIDSEKTRAPKAPFFASYVLDDCIATSRLLDNVEKSEGLYHQRLLPKPTASKRWDRSYCTVAQWLRYLRDCDAVVTDSFHGCVFSIIYNKPFVCLGNEGRGSARFDTLFQVFGLEDRLVTSRDLEEVLRVLRKPIDWARVNAIHESERQRGLDFLRRNLYDGVSPDGYEQG